MVIKKLSVNSTRPDNKEKERTPFGAPLGRYYRQEVLEGCDIDTNEYSGFAFGIGIERIAMLKYGINNIKLLFESDMRVLKQIDD